MTDSNEQLILNLDLIDSLKVLSVYKSLADEIKALKETNKGLSETNKELNAKLDLEEQECASRMDCHVATKLEERVIDLQNVSRTYKKELDLEHMRYMEKTEEVSKLKQEVKRLEREDDQMEDTLASLNFYKTEVAELKEQREKLMNPVTNNDSRCGVVRVRCNYSYLAEFMECEHVDIYQSRDVDEQQAYDGVIEKMSKEVENVLDTYLQDSKICFDQELNIVIYERMTDIISQAVTDGIITKMDNSSDED
tara:strand:- start:5819 stop:6574 length:756 start_codon:yes stop_codon:yes gene_type:complete